MSKITDNGNGTVTIEKQLLKDLFEQYKTTQSDVELSVQTIAKVLQILGIIQADGNFKEDFRFRHLLQNLTGIVTQSLTNSSGLQKKFSFITDPACIAVIEKYSYLYSNRGVKKDTSITDLEFENL